MHKDDQMTPNERMEAMFSGKGFDRIPAMPFVVSIAGKMAGMTHSEKRSSAKNQAKAQIVSYEKLGHDGMCIEYGLHGIGKACGTKCNYPEDGVPAITEHCLKDIKNVDKDLDLEMVLLKNDSWFQLNHEACQICLDKYGSEVGANAIISGPFTAAASIYPVEKLLRATVKDPENLHKLLDFCTEASKLVIKEFIKIGGGIFISDPVASCDLIHPQTYREFVMPYTKRQMDFIHSLGAGAGYHICGNANPILENMLETGCDTLSIDTKVKLTDARKVSEEKAILLGNVKPLETMMLGTYQDVFDNVRQDIIDSWGAKKGYILGTGCDIPLNTPIENMFAFMDAARTFGKYPIDVEKLKRIK